MHTHIVKIVSQTWFEFLPNTVWERGASPSRPLNRICHFWRKRPAFIGQKGRLGDLIQQTLYYLISYSLLKRKQCFWIHNPRQRKRLLDARWG